MSTHDRKQTSISRLRLLADALASGNEDQRWLGATIDQVLDQGGSFDEAFGVTWAHRLGARDRKIREIHRRYFPDDEPYAVATKLEKLKKDLEKIQAAGRFDQIALDDPRRLIAEAMELGLPSPKKRQLINVLGVQ